MTSGPSGGLPPHERLRSAGEFRRVFRRGMRIDGPLFLLVVDANAQGFPRLGLAVSRKVGGAVDRNRAKRLLRAAFRRLKPEGALDLVFVAKREIVLSSLGGVEREYRERLRRLASRGASRGHGPHPSRPG